MRGRLVFLYEKGMLLYFVKFILLLTISANLCADDNLTLDTLDFRLDKLEQENSILKNENTKLAEKIILIEKQDRLLTIKEFAEEINSDSWVTIFISFLALIVSAISAWISIKKERLSMEAIPVSLNKTEGVSHYSSAYYNDKSDHDFFGIEIRNSSAFGIKIRGISFKIKTDKANKYIPENGFFDNGKEQIIFPLSIEAKDSKVILFRISDIKEARPGSVAVELTTGETIHGSSKALNSLVAH
jgi:hypothetical protein